MNPFSIRNTLEKAETRLIRIAIVGPESTGKSALSQALARHYHTVFVPEVARTFLQNLGRPYTEADVEAIARRQLESEEQMAALANRILFCDTSLHVIQVWMENAYGHCPPWIAESVRNRPYDLFLLTDIDLDWEPDPLREHPDKRPFFMDWYTRMMQMQQKPWALISGIGPQRTQKAIERVNALFKDLETARVS